MFLILYSFLSVEDAGNSLPQTWCIKSLDNDEVVVQVVSSGVGAISESDVHLAHTSGATIYGFSTQLPSSIKRLVSRKNAMEKSIADAIQSATGADIEVLQQLLTAVRAL